MADLTQTPALGDALRAAREAKGWSRRTLADRSATSEATIARVELYGHDPKVATLRCWAEALELPMGTLLDSTPPEAA